MVFIKYRQSKRRKGEKVGKNGGNKILFCIDRVEPGRGTSTRAGREQHDILLQYVPRIPAL